MSDRERTIAREKANFSIAEEAHQALAEILAKNPVALAIIYETEVGIDARPVPNSGALTRGLVAEMHDSLEQGMGLA